ncbi:MAG: DUF420 domain-containing protein [Bacteroidota bacterium]
MTSLQRALIIITSIAIPVVVVLISFIKIPGVDLSFLPPVYAGINGVTALTLIAAMVAIKNGNRLLHERLMKLSIALSLLFLLGYVAYHITHVSTYFGDVDHDGVLTDVEKQAVGSLRLIYFLILASHILLCMAIVPMVLITYVKGITQQFGGHRKIGKYTWPIWLYIAITGVVVYFMISPYY